MTSILLVAASNKPNRFAYWSYPPLGLGYLASYLRKYHDIKHIKIVERLFEYNVNLLLRKYKPDIIGISCTTQEYSTACKLASEVKRINRDILVIIGGHHISSVPYSLISDINIGVIGEAEETFAEIVAAYEKGQSDYDKIKGIVYWKNGQLSITEKRPQIKPLDKIPFPARDLMKIGIYTHLLSSRGCPYHCIYCSSSRFWNSCRFHSPEYVVAEIKEIIEKYRVHNIHFTDDLFIASKKRVEAISNLIKKERINEVAQFHCLARANLLNEEVIKNLRQMNMVALSMGFETGCEEVLSRIKRGSVTIQQNKAAVKLARKYGVSVDGLFMIGAPGETKENMMETYNFIKENALTQAEINVMVPYPGTDIWDYATAKKLVNDKMDWDLLDMDFAQNTDKFIVIDDALSREELIQMFFKIKNVTMQRLPFSRRLKTRALEAFQMGMLLSLTKAVHSSNTPDALLSSGYRVLKRFGLARVI